MTTERSEKMEFEEIDHGTMMSRQTVSGGHWKST
jgi:hypothetical protein